MPGDPASAEIYNQLYESNTKCVGNGLHTAIEMACPFCAAPGWLTVPVLQSFETLQRGAVCKACGRGARMRFNTDQDGAFSQLVQTEGNDPPPWMGSRIPRAATLTRPPHS